MKSNMYMRSDISTDTIKTLKYIMPDISKFDEKVIKTSVSYYFLQMQKTHLERLEYYKALAVMVACVGNCFSENIEQNVIIAKKLIKCVAYDDDINEFIIKLDNSELSKAVKYLLLNDNDY